MYKSDSEFDAYDYIAELVDLTKPGIFVDVGAGFPTGGYTAHTLFRSYPLWRIIAIEANPKMCQAYRDLGYEVYEYAATDEDKGKVSFDVYAYADGLGGSCITNQNAQHSGEARQLHIDSGYIRVIEVTALTLNTILSTHCPEVTHINILNVDVEYSELQVLRGLDFTKYSPDVMLIENLSNSQVYRDYFDQLGYKIIGEAAQNQILIRK